MLPSVFSGLPKFALALESLSQKKKKKKKVASSTLSYQFLFPCQIRAVTIDPCHRRRHPNPNSNLDDGYEAHQKAAAPFSDEPPRS